MITLILATTLQGQRLKLRAGRIWKSAFSLVANSQHNSIAARRVAVTRNVAQSAKLDHHFPVVRHVSNGPVAFRLALDALKAFTNGFRRFF